MSKRPKSADYLRGYQKEFQAGVDKGYEMGRGLPPLHDLGPQPNIPRIPLPSWPPNDSGGIPQTPPITTCRTETHLPDTTALKEH